MKILLLLVLLIFLPHSLESSKVQRGQRGIRNQDHESTLSQLNSKQKQSKFKQSLDPKTINLAQISQQQPSYEYQSPEVKQLTELEVLAKKAESSGGISNSLASTKNMVINCQQINPYNKNYEKEELILCQLCEGTRGIRIRESKNWYKELQLTQKENATFNSIYSTINQLFPDTHLSFILNGNYMCFATTKMQGQYSLNKISKALHGSQIDNGLFLQDQSDVVSPYLMAIRYELDPLTRAPVDSQFILQSYLPLQTQYEIGDYFNFTLTDQIIDTFMNSMQFIGSINTTYKDISMPCRISIPLSQSNLIDGNFSFIIEPFLDTMEINTFYQIFHIPKSFTDSLMMPKGISSINNLPVDFVSLSYENADQVASGDTPKSISIQFRAPDYIFMPKIWFRDVSGLLQINNYNLQTELNVYLTGNSDMDGQLIQTNVEKQSKDDFYSVYMKSNDGNISIEYIEEEIYQTFNVYPQDFWPRDNNISMNLIQNQLNLEDKVILQPQIKVFWIPRLMQQVGGHISIFDTNDAYIHILMSNLAGTTLQNTHLVFNGEHSQSAFYRIFSLNNLAYYSELKAFDIVQLELSFTNQDIDLNSWPNIKEINPFADEGFWVQGCMVKLTLKLKESFTDLFSQSYAHIFRQLVGDTVASQEFILKGTLLNNNQMQLQVELPNIQLSQQVSLLSPKFVVSFNISQFLVRNVSEPQYSLVDIESYIEGHIQLKMDSNGASLTFLTKIDASSEEWISLDGTMNGLYNKLLDLQDSHLSQVKMHGQLDYSGNVRNVSLHGLGLFGDKCFQISSNYRSNKQLEGLMEAITQNNKNQEFTMGFSDPVTRVLFQSIINQADLLNTSDQMNCFTGDIKYGLNLTDYSYSYMRGHIWVDSLKSLLHYAIQSTQSSTAHFYSLYSSLIYPLASLQFENGGIDMSYSPIRSMHYHTISIPRGFRFDGNVRFLGIKAYAIIDYGESKKYARQGKWDLKIEIVLPSFTMGSDNIMIICLQDFYVSLTQDEKSRVTSNPITLQATIYPDSLDSLQSDSAQLQISANIKVFDYITQTILILDQDYLTFTVKTKPFNGVFEAQVAGFLRIDQENGDITSQDDQPCFVNASFNTGQREFMMLQDRVNKVLYDEWIVVGSRAIYMYYERATQIMQHLNLMKSEAELCDIHSCQQQYQCIEDPSVKCLEYKLIKECTDSQQSCQGRGYDMVCESMKSQVLIGGTKDHAFYTNVCQAWDFVCNEDSSYQSQSMHQEDICMRYEYTPSYQFCTNFKLDCQRGFVQDEYCQTKCLDKQEQFEAMQMEQKNYLVLSEAASSIFGPLQLLYQAVNNTHLGQSLITISQIQINADLSSQTWKPQDYNLTVKYFLSNLGPSYAREVEVSGDEFDYLYLDIAAKGIAAAIRKDICDLYNMSWALADNLDIALNRLQRAVQALSQNVTGQLLTKEEVIYYVINGTEKEALEMDEIIGMKTTRIQIASNRIAQKPTPKANIFITNSIDTLMPGFIPSGLDMVDYDFERNIAINEELNM